MPRTLSLAAVFLGTSFAVSPVFAVDFDTQVIPILTRSGCNAGACHGAAIGRGGFKLSLYGGNPAADRRAIVYELEGRRVNFADAESSLLLLKPSGLVPHGGGVRLPPDGPGAQLLTRWIRDGAARVAGRRLKDFRVRPAAAIVDQPGDGVPLQASAVFDDGTTEDVAQWTVFTTIDAASVELRFGIDAYSDSSSAKPDSTGAVVHRRGEHIVTARYLDRVLPVRVALPFSDSPVDLSREPRQNFIDKHVLAKLAALRLPVSPPAEDAAWLRRVRLDLTGRLPTPAEVQEFQNGDPQVGRTKTVDRLLASDAFTEYWTYRLAELLRIRANPQEDAAARTYHAWLNDAVARDAPWDEIARKLLTSEGDSHTLGPPNFYRVKGGPRAVAEHVSETLLGVRLACANCHNHPLDRWTQDDYHGLAAVFAKLETGRVVRFTNRGAVTHPRTGEPAVPQIPGGRTLSADVDARAELAAWLTNARNPWFARALVNRLWRAMMGRGLIEPPDDLSDTNPATHPQLLEALAADCIEHGYSIRHTLRRIALSATYARSAVSLPENRNDDRLYSHALERRLPPEVLADAISDVTGVPTRYGDEKPGTRAVALFSPTVASTGLDVLGRCDRLESCETAGVSGGGLSLKLHLINGPLVNQKITAPNGRLAQLTASDQSDVEIVDEFYRRALSRTPNKEERRFWDEQFNEAATVKHRRELLQDVVWSLLNCREFATR